jgi:hypothetical protein
MGRCESCRFWTPNEPHTLTQHIERFGLCAMADNSTEDYPNGPVYLEVGAGYTSAYLHTRPDFGCVRHEPRA